MVMHYAPAFKIEADGTDITQRLLDCNTSLEVTDTAGWKSDALKVTLAAGDIALPATGAELRVWLGYADQLRPMGLFVVDSISLPIPTTAMTIKALGAPHDHSQSLTALQTRKSRSWRPTTIKELVTALASEHGLNPAISAELAGIALDHIDQTEESDMHLLTRLAAAHDAIAKANGGALIFVPRAGATSTTGQSMPSLSLTPENVTSGKVTISKREGYKTVISRWRDNDAAMDAEIVVGTGEPIYRIRGAYPSAEAAQRAAKGKLQAFQRGTSTLSLTLPGRPELVAESRLTLSGFRTGISGEWSVTQVIHTLTPQKGYVTTVQAEVPK